MTTAMTIEERLGRIETGQEGIKDRVEALDRNINSIHSSLMQATIASLSTSVLILGAVITLKFI